MVKADTRTKNSTRNIIFSMIAYMIQIVLGFLVRRYFIYYFNEEYLGLSSLFTNVISLLSLAELGFGTALVFSMYKPMAEGNEERVKQLLQFYKKCYFIIGTIVLCVGLCVLPFMNFFKSKAPNVDVNLYVVYLINLFNSVMSYYFAHRRSLLYVNQRNDIESKINMVLNILLTALQLLAVCLFKNYYLYISLSIFSTLLNNLLIFVITQKLYPSLVKKSNEKLDKEVVKEINKNIFSMVCHKIGGAVVYSTDSLLIFIMLGSSSLGKYSNYLLITTYITAFINIFLGAIRGSVGNSIASEDVEKNYSLFKKINFVYFFIVSFCTICIFVLADPFIDIILTKDPSVNLTLDKTILTLVCVSFYCLHSRYIVCIFKECAGLFYEDRIKPLFEAVVNLIVSIVLAKFIGLAGIIIGTIVSNVFVCLVVEPFILNKYYFKKSTKKYMLQYVLYTLSMVTSGIVTILICNFIPNSNIIYLGIKMLICAMVCGISLLLTMSPFKEFKECVSWGKEIIKNLRNKINNNKSIEN